MTLPPKVPFKARLRNGEVALVDAIATKDGYPYNVFPYRGWRGPPGNIKYMELWGVDGRYQDDGAESVLDIIAVLV